MRLILYVMDFHKIVIDPVHGMCVPIYLGMGIFHDAVTFGRRVCEDVRAISEVEEKKATWFQMLTGCFHDSQASSSEFW